MSESEPAEEHKRDRLRLWLVATPIVGLTVAVWVGNALAPTLVSESPNLLLLLSPRLEFAALVSTKVDMLPYYLIPLLRASAVLVSWYLLGRWYNDRALRWAEKQTGKAAKPLLWVERNFEKARYPITFLFPINITAMLAGASRMWPPGFFVVALVSIEVRYWAVRSLADQFRDSVISISEFVSRYQTYLTVGTVVLVFVWISWSQREGFRQPDSVEELIEEFEPDAPTEDL